MAILCLYTGVMCGMTECKESCFSERTFTKATLEVVSPQKPSDVLGVALESTKKATEGKFSRKCPINGMTCYNSVDCDTSCAGIGFASVGTLKVSAGDPAAWGGGSASSDKAIVHGVGPDAPIETNAKGAKQSSLPYRCDLLPALALLHQAKILKGGADKYGDNNWRDIAIADHINHAMTHILAYLAGDKSDDHLGHATCRMLMALEISLGEEMARVE